MLLPKKLLTIIGFRTKRLNMLSLPRPTGKRCLHLHRLVHIWSIKLRMLQSILLRISEKRWRCGSYTIAQKDACLISVDTKPILNWAWFREQFARSAVEFLFDMAYQKKPLMQLNVYSYMFVLRQLENHSCLMCILRSPAAAGAVTNGSPAAAAAAQFLGCSFC